MAEEDLIFGKNRHMFGGIEPSNMLKFAVTPKNGKIQITAQLPKDTMIDGQLLCTVGGAVIRRKTTGYPVDEFDGDFVAKITESRTIIDSTADTSKVYYYAAFPFSTQDVYNRGYKNRAIYDYPEAEYYYGYDLDLNDSNPATRVTYPSDVMNANYKPAGMNFSKKVFNYGGWPSTAGDKFMPKPCIINANGKVITYLNQNDYSLTVDGSASNIANTYYMVQNKRNAMMEWPKIYTHREVVGNVYKFRCSDIPLGDDWDCICNYDINDNQIDHFYTAIYPSPSHSESSGSVLTMPFSISGKQEFLGYGSSLIDVLQYPKNIGPDWNIEVLADRLLIQDLLVMMARTTDGQKAYGERNTSSKKITGTGDAKGLFYGGNSSWSSLPAVKVFGMEGFYGFYPRLMAGFLIDKDDLKVKLTVGTHDGSSTTNYNNTGTGYIKIGSLADYMTTTGSYIGYISGTLNESFGRIPILKNGSSTTYECDQMDYLRDSSGEPKYPIVGGLGSASSGDGVGPFSIDMTNSSTASGTSGAIALSCKPRRNS